MEVIKMCENMTEFILHAESINESNKKILDEANKEINEFVNERLDSNGICYASELAEILEKTWGFSARYKDVKFHGIKTLEG